MTRRIVVIVVTVSFGAAVLGFVGGMLVERGRNDRSPATATVRAEIGPRILTPSGYTSVEARDGFLWVRADGGAAWGDESGPKFYRINMRRTPYGAEGPLRRASLPRLSFPADGLKGGAPLAVIAGLTSWRADPEFIRSTHSEQTVLRQVDRGTGRRLGRPVVVPGLPDAVATAEGYVWVVTRNEIEVGHRLWQIDARRHVLAVPSLRIADAVGLLSPYIERTGHSLWLASESAVIEVDLIADRRKS